LNAAFLPPFLFDADLQLSRLLPPGFFPTALWQSFPLGSGKSRLYFRLPLSVSGSVLRTASIKNTSCQPTSKMTLKEPCSFDVKICNSGVLIHFLRIF